MRYKFWAKNYNIAIPLPLFARGKWLYRGGGMAMGGGGGEMAL